MNKKKVKYSLFWGLGGWLGKKHDPFGLNQKADKLEAEIERRLKIQEAKRKKK